MEKERHILDRQNPILPRKVIMCSTPSLRNTTLINSFLKKDSSHTRCVQCNNIKPINNNSTCDYCLKHGNKSVWKSIKQ